ncbi:MAG: T9SS type A sorting domain-containing protein, partial [Candidatus Aquicultor sp.]
LVYQGDSIHFISNISDFVFSTIYYNYQFVDSVINDDNQAKSYAGSNNSDVYYKKLWELSGSYTESLFKNASYKLACLIYTAWLNAGSPPFPGTSGVTSMVNDSPSFRLEQNYPNPFNPETVISYQLPAAGNVSLKVYDMLGRKAATLINEYQGAGVHHSQFSIINSQLSSGVYFYRLAVGAYSSTKKMIVLK